MSFAILIAGEPDDDVIDRWDGAVYGLIKALHALLLAWLPCPNPHSGMWWTCSARLGCYCIRSDCWPWQRSAGAGGGPHQAGGRAWVQRVGRAVLARPAPASHVLFLRRKGTFEDMFLQLLREEGEEWRLYFVFRGEFPSEEELAGLDGFVITGSVCVAGPRHAAIPHCGSACSAWRVAPCRAQRIQFSF